MKAYFLVFICGLIFPLGFAPFNFWPLTILSISCLIYLLNIYSSSNSFTLGFVYGLGLWGAGISWLYVSIHYHGNISIIGSLFIIFSFVVILSLFSGLTTFLYKILKTEKLHLDFIVLFPAIWLSIEILRSNIFTGFPWLIIGDSLSGTFIGGWIPVLGTFGGSLTALIIAGIIPLILKFKDYQYPSLLLIVLISSFTLNNINWTKELKTISISIHQPNLTLKEKWSGEGIYQTMNLFQRSISNAEQGEFIFFPETALILNEDRMKPWILDLSEEAKSKDLSLITGIVARYDINKNDKSLNRVKGYGIAEGYYDKVQLVPFGEYIPLRVYLGKFLDILGVNMTDTMPGSSFKPIEVNNLRISANICYEVAFNELVRETAKNSNFIVSITNDTWFGSSIGPYQHLEIAQTRALEHQKPLVRATNSGISAVIDKNGKIIASQGFFEEKELKLRIPVYEGRTPFSITGNKIIYVYIIFIMLYLLINKRTYVLKYNNSNDKRT